jgi:formamidopyrimidine-DNA glycosylase
MPELPDIDLYVESLTKRIVGATLDNITIANPFLLRSVEPPVAAAYGREVSEIRRLGKRIVIGLDDDFWLVLHLMIAGRLQWRNSDSGTRARNQLAEFRFSPGRLILTEAGSKKRASLYVVSGENDLSQHDPGGVEPLVCSLTEFRQRLRQENRTLKRALTSPKSFSGIGNAYSDEILHAARLSPFTQTSKISDAQTRRLFEATRAVLNDWSDRLRAEAGGEFPKKVTAFHSGMAVHGKFGKPCPECGSPVQRIRYKSNETNYCANCQTGGKVLADRSLSRLLKDDWPKTIEDKD